MFIKRNLGPLAFIAALFALSCTMLATSPQNPDGAEMITAALRGGVLHPPGFPLQAWINRALVQLPFFPPAKTLALFSLIAQVATLGFLYKLLQALSLSPLAIVVGLASYSLFPANWHLSVQPEKYTFLMAFMACALFQLKKISDSDNPSGRDLLLCGLTMGLGFSQHPLFGLLTPAIAFVCLRLRAPQKIVTLLMPAVITAAAFYASFLLLTIGAAWPDWGKLQSVGAAYAQAVSAGVKFVALSGKATRNNSFIFVGEDFVRAFTVLGLLLPLGLVSLARSKKRFELFAIASTFVGCLVFLARCDADWPELIARTYFERYGIFAMFFASILMAIGWDEASKKIPHRVAPVAAGAIVVFITLLAFNGYERADASRDGTFDVFREVLENTLPGQAFYVAGNDIEGLYGLRTPTGYRFPIVNLDYSWYRQRAIRLIEPRLKTDSPDPPGVEVIIEVAFNKGFEVYSTDVEALTAPNRVAQQRGLFWVIGKDIKAPLSERTVEAAERICQVLTRTKPGIPTEGHFLSQALWMKIRQAFFGAHIFLKSKGEMDRATLAEKIGQGLFGAQDPATWLAACAEFSRH